MNKDQRILLSAIVPKIKNRAMFMNLKYTVADSLSTKMKLFLKREYSLDLDFDVFMQNNKIVVNTEALKKCTTEQLLEIHTKLVLRPYIFQNDIELFKQLLIEYRKFMLKRLNLELYKQQHTLSTTSMDMFLFDEYLKFKDEILHHLPKNFYDYVFCYLTTNVEKGKPATFSVNVGCPFYQIHEDSLQASIEYLKRKIHKQFECVVDYVIIDNSDERICKTTEAIYKNIPWYLPLPNIKVTALGITLEWEDHNNFVKIHITDSVILIQNEQISHSITYKIKNDVLSGGFMDVKNMSYIYTCKHDDIIKKINTVLEVFNHIKVNNDEF